jgi:putative membrane protein
MKLASSLRLIAYLLGFGGALLLTALIIREGAAKIVAGLASASWAFPVAVAITVPRFLCDAAAWVALVPKENRPSFCTAIWIRWVGGSVNDLLPSARLGGDILTARLATISAGLTPGLAVGVAVVNMTVSVCMRIFVTAGCLVLIAGITGQGRLYIPSLLAGLIALVVVAGFYTIQRFGFFRLAGVLVSRVKFFAKWNSRLQGGAKFDDILRALYSRRRALLTYGLLWTVSWLIGCVETWIVLFALGIPTSFIAALIVETAGQGIRSVLFIVPAGLGVFEGGLLMICSLFGIPGEVALALALIRRGREALFSAPGLIVWQLVEARRMLRRTGENERERAGARGNAGSG